MSETTTTTGGEQPKIVLYCQRCGDNHAYSLGDTERLIYSLQASYQEALGPRPDDHTQDMRDAWAKCCLGGFLSEANDIEAFAEHVGGLVDDRLTKQTGVPHYEGWPEGSERD